MRFSHFVAIAATTLALGLSHAPPAYADDAGDKSLTAAETAMNKAAKAARISNVFMASWATSGGMC